MSDSQERVVLPLRNDTLAFPNPRNFDDEGLLAYGGDLSVPRLLQAYSSGVFPWYGEGDPILWWSPNPRLVLYPNNFKVRKSFARVLRNGNFEVRFDSDFLSVIEECAEVFREGQPSTWIRPEMKEAYSRLHQEGYAHSVEVYKQGKLVGGLYGVSLGKAFFGESMFSKVTDASKVAFKALSDVLRNRGYDFIDCQMKTEHLVRMGAEVVARDRFLDELTLTLEKPSVIGSWHELKWEYEDGK